MVSMVTMVSYGQPYDNPKLRRSLEDELLLTVEGMLRDYAATTETWETPVEFDFEVDTTGEEFTAIVGTDNQIYEWVNNGTGSAAGNRADWYPILPRNAKALAYQSQFTPKTQPGVLKARDGGKRGPVDVFRSVSYHPGIEPRGFDETITAKWQPLFARRFDRRLADFYRAHEALQAYRQISRR